MRKKLFWFLALGLLCLNNAYGQECPDTAAKSSGTIRFRQPGEEFEIPILVAGCESIAMELRWANGRSNGSNFNVIFRDSEGLTIYTKHLSGFLTGTFQFPFATLDPRPWYGSGSMISVPSTVVIQAVQPFAFPANISYTVIRIDSKAKDRKTDEHAKEGESVERVKEGERGKQGNEIVSIHRAVRLIGSSRVQLVQIELKTARPFPVRDTALHLQIGRRLFLNELSGDHTGRMLTVSLTPEMFTDLEDGAEIVAFFSNSERGGSSSRDVWHFGRLDKKVMSQ